jgi:hypothetical protein
MTGQEAHEKLIQGNGRFVAGEGVGAADADLASMVASQSPIAKTGSVTILAEDGY